MKSNSKFRTVSDLLALRRSLCQLQTPNVSWLLLDELRVHLDLQTSYKVTNTTKYSRKVLKNLLQGTYRIRGRGEISLTFPNMAFVILVPSLPLLRKRKILQIKLAKCLQCLSLQCIRADSMLANRDRVRGEWEGRGVQGAGTSKKKATYFPPFSILLPHANFSLQPSRWRLE